jgi:hypothetical protein
VNKKVFVQKQNRDWLNENCYIAQRGFQRMGYQVIPFELHDLDGLDFDGVLFAGLNTMHKIMDKRGITIPEVHNVEDHLGVWCMDRKMETITIGEIHHSDYPFFVKPKDEYKLFTGFVANTDLDMMKLSGITADTRIVVSEIIDIASEYRCFVLDGKLVGCKNYTGSYEVLPDFDFVRRAIDDYKEAPIAYTLDVGIRADGGTTLIEINDGYGFGNYGFNYILYCRMIEARWHQIIGGIAK